MMSPQNKKNYFMEKQILLVLDRATGLPRFTKVPGCGLLLNGDVVLAMVTYGESDQMKLDKEVHDQNPLWAKLDEVSALIGLTEESVCHGIMVRLYRVTNRGGIARGAKKAVIGEHSSRPLVAVVESFAKALLNFEPGFYGMKIDDASLIKPMKDMIPSPSARKKLATSGLGLPPIELIGRKRNEADGMGVTLYEEQLGGLLEKKNEIDAVEFAIQLTPVYTVFDVEKMGEIGGAEANGLTCLPIDPFLMEAFITSKAISIGYGPFVSRTKECILQSRGYPEASQVSPAQLANAKTQITMLRDAIRHEIGGNMLEAIVSRALMQILTPEENVVKYMVTESGDRADAINYHTAKATIEWARSHKGKEFPRKVMMLCDMVVAWNDELVSDVEAVIKGLGTLFLHRNGEGKIPVWYNLTHVEELGDNKLPPPPFLLVGSPAGPVSVYGDIDKDILETRIG